MARKLSLGRPKLGFIFIGHKLCTLWLLFLSEEYWQFCSVTLSVSLCFFHVEFADGAFTLSLKFNQFFIPINQFVMKVFHSHKSIYYKVFFKTILRDIVYLLHGYFTHKYSCIHATLFWQLYDRKVKKKDADTNLFVKFTLLVHKDFV